MNKKTLKLAVLPKFIAVAGIFVGSLFIQSCGGDGSPRIMDADEITIYESTQGVETEVEEQEPGGQYLIIDERLIDDKEQSIAIIHNLDNTIDTVSMRALKKQTYTGRHTGLQSILMYSLAASYFRRNMNGVRPNSSYYKNQNAYSKSTGLKDNLTSSATSRKVKSPKGSSRGFGSNKSFRSYGG